MSAGTLKLTNNSTAIVGTSTLFTTDLKPGDFIVATIGGVLYTLPVDTVTSDTAATLISVFTGPTTTGAAWAAVPQKTMARVTAELVAQSTEAMRGLLAEKGVWTNFYTAPGDITIQLAGMPATSGPGWQKIAELVNSSQQWRGSLPANANLNGYGPVQNFVGSWGMETTAGAQPTNGFPETNAAGLLEVFAGGQFGGTQRYTTTGGRVYVRTLTAAWNGTDGPWSTWVQVGRELVPISQGGTGKTTAAESLQALIDGKPLPLAADAVDAGDAVTKRQAIDISGASAFIRGLDINLSLTTLEVDVGAAYVPGANKIIEVSAKLTRPIGTVTPSTWYHIYLYDNNGTPAIEASTSSPTAYAYPAHQKTGDATRRYLGSFHVYGSGGVNPQVHKNGRCYHNVDWGSVRLLSAGVATTYTAVSIATTVPVTAKTIRFAGTNTSTAAARAVYVSPSAVDAGATFQPGNKYIADIIIMSYPNIYYKYANPPESGAGFYIDIGGYEYAR